VLCALAVGLKYKYSYDDSLDVVGVHLVGGLVGTILIGFFATSGLRHSVFPDGALPGLFYGGGFRQLAVQILSSILAVVFCFGMTWLIATILDRVMGWRVAADDEMTGIDLTQHGETAYESTSRSALGHTASFHTTTVADRLRAATNAGTPADVLPQKVVIEEVQLENAHHG
jgi:Amt family ammonium transporter